MNFRGKTYNLAAIIPLLKTIVRDYKSKIFLNVILGWIIVGLNFVFVWFTKQTIDAATVTHDRSGMVRLCILLVSTILFQAVLSVFYKRSKTLIEFHLRRRLQQRCFDNILAAQWENISSYHTGDIVRRIEYDGAEITSFLTDTLPSILLVLLQLTGAFVFLFILDERIAGTLILLMLAGVFISKFHFLKIRKFSAKIKETGSMFQAALQENVQHLGVLKSLIDNSIVRRYLSSILDLKEQNVRSRLKYSIFSSTVLNIGFASCYLLVFIWGAFSLESGAITYGSLIAFVQLVGQVQGPSRTLIRSISDFAEFYTSCERLNEIETLPHEEKHTLMSLEVAPAIVCRNLSYTYNNGRKVIFDNLNYTFEQGTFTTIVGTTGAGKTTLLRLLLAYVSPTGGKIELTTDTGATLPVDERTRSLFAYVPQGNTLFSVSLRDNLRLGNPESTEQQMREALEWACADFVVTLPDGLDTQCGEDGKGFSQGQAQRLCIARALLSPSPILLMDEATSALDRTTEEKIISNLRKHLARKTILFITHRDTAIPYADQVLKIEEK